MAKQGGSGGMLNGAGGCESGGDRRSGRNGSNANSRRTAIVVGAGPAGCVMSMYLAKQGFNVRVLERRSDPSRDDVSKKSFVVGLNPRGTTPLVELGVRLPKDGWVSDLAPNKGVVSHLADGTTIKRPRIKDNIAAERAALAAHLLQEARRLHPTIDFDFDAAIKDIDLGSHSLVLASSGQENPPQRIPYDLLVAADGASSQVRQAVAAQVEEFCVSRDQHPRTYVVARNLPPVPGIEPEAKPGEPDAFGRHLHFFNPSPPDALRQPILGCAAYVHEDNTYSMIIVVDKGWQPPASGSEMQAALQAALPQLPQTWLEAAAAQVAGSRARSWGSTVTCSRLAIPEAGVLLVGDAGHGVTPNMGQGCNAALESAQVAAKALTANPGNLEHALRVYDHARRPDALALAHMDIISRRWWGDGGTIVKPGRWNRHYAATIANMTVSGTLHRLMPSLWGPNFMEVLLDNELPYHYAVWSRRRDSAIAAAVLASAGCALAWVTAHAISWLT